MSNFNDLTTINSYISSISPPFYTHLCISSSLRSYFCLLNTEIPWFVGCCGMWKKFHFSPFLYQLVFLNT